MNPLEPTYEIATDDDLSKFLLGAIRDVRKSLLAVESAVAISQLADKYIKLKIARALEKRISESAKMVEIDSELNRGLLQKSMP